MGDSTLSHFLLLLTWYIRPTTFSVYTGFRLDSFCDFYYNKMKVIFVCILSGDTKPNNTETL